MKRISEQFSRNFPGGIFGVAAILLLSGQLIFGLSQTTGQKNKSVPLQNQDAGSQEPAKTDELKAPKQLNRQGKIARAQGRVDFNQPGIGKPQAAALNRAFQELDLTEDQKVKIRSVWVQYGEQLRRLTSLRRAKAIVFDDALYNTQFDAADAEKKASDLAQTEGELIKTQMKMIIEIRQVMNAEQGTKFRQILEEERARPLRALQGGANP